MNIAKQLIFAIILVLLAGCGEGLTQAGEFCGSDDECESGCCLDDYNKSDFMECSYFDKDSSTKQRCMEGGPCCKYETRSGSISANSSYSGGWSEMCVCYYSSCSEIKTDTECYGGTCSTTYVQKVVEVPNCD
jgi:hypothetical protein